MISRDLATFAAASGGVLHGANAPFARVISDSRALEPGVVMTVEPGIYVAPDTKDIPEQYLGIGVRIEDDVLCTSNGPRVLTTKVPKDADEIEALMAG